jgi:CopG antitoxin of type II toxin-antitoxin system
MADAKRSSVSKADSLEGMGEFWDRHDFTDFDSDAPDVDFEVRCAVPVETHLLAQVESQAHQRGISVEALVEEWLQEKVQETARR